MTKEEQQQIFDIVCKHLLTQKKRAILLEKYSCAYRTSDGLKCAIGCLIKDEYYQEKMEKKQVSNYFVWSALEKSLGIDLDYNNDEQFFIDLQTVHDKDIPDFWKFSLKYFATKYSLTFNES